MGGLLLNNSKVFESALLHDPVACCWWPNICSFGHWRIDEKTIVSRVKDVYFHLFICFFFIKVTLERLLAWKLGRTVFQPIGCWRSESEQIEWMDVISVDNCTVHKSVVIRVRSCLSLVGGCGNQNGCSHFNLLNGVVDGPLVSDVDIGHSRF